MTVILILLCTQHAALIKFRNRIANFQERFGTIHSINKECSEESAINHATRSMIGNVKTLEKRCFICNEIWIVDNNPYNEGGLQRCSRGPQLANGTYWDHGSYINLAQDLKGNPNMQSELNLERVKILVTVTNCAIIDVFVTLQRKFFRKCPSWILQPLYMDFH